MSRVAQAHDAIERAFSASETVVAIRLIVVASLIGLFSPSPAESQTVECWYRSKLDEGTMMSEALCGEPNGFHVSLSPEVIERLYFDEDDLSCVSFTRDDTYLVHRNGKTARAPMYDLSCPRFEEGLSIAMLEDGRLGYIDKTLEVVLDPGFETVGYFDEGYARVCNGPFTYEQMGEHVRRKGGQCGLIDRSGELVMELRYPSEESVPFTDFRNANNHCPPPPIEDEAAALCHALRHAMSEEWIDYSIEMVDDRWEVIYSFWNRNRVRTNSIELGREKADVRWHGRHDLRTR